MEPSHAYIIDPVNRHTHGYTDLYRLFGYRDIGRSPGNDGNERKARIRAFFRQGVDKAGAPPRVEPCVREPVFKGPQLLRTQSGEKDRNPGGREAVGDLENFLDGLAFAVDHLGKSLPEVPVVIQSGERQLVLAQGAVLQPRYPFICRDAPLGHRLQECFDFFRCHDTPPPMR